MCLMSIVTASVMIGATTGLSSTRASAQNCAAGGAVIPTCDYTYAPFGDSSATGALAQLNPWRFSSEHADDETGCVYYNYRPYEPTMGRWLLRNPKYPNMDENLYIICNNGLIDRMDYNGLSKIKPDINGQCPKKCCNGKLIQLVPIWHCTRKLGGTGPTSIPLLNHQYICCNGVNSVCFGVQKYIRSCLEKCKGKKGKDYKICKESCRAKKGSIVEREEKTSGECEMLCVSPDEKDKACNGCARLPEDYAIGPHGIDCQEWSDEMTSSKCK